MPASRPIDDMFEGHMFLILGITLLAILNVLFLVRSGPGLLTASVAVVVVLLIAAAGWLLIAWGTHQFMRAALDVEASRGAQAPSKKDGPSDLEILRENRRRVMLTRVLPLAVLVAVVLILFLWDVL